MSAVVPEQQLPGRRATKAKSLVVHGTKSLYWRYTLTFGIAPGYVAPFYMAKLLLVEALEVTFQLMVVLLTASSQSETSILATLLIVGANLMILPSVVWWFVSHALHDSSPERAALAVAYAELVFDKLLVLASIFLRRPIYSAVSGFWRQLLFHGGPLVASAVTFLTLFDLLGFLQIVGLVY